MNNILILGAGRSSTACINYVLRQAKEHNWFVVVADADLDLATQKVNNHPNGRGVWLDASKPSDRHQLISRADVVISLLPPQLHLEVAYDCIKLKKHLITASYVSKDIYKLSDDFRNKELIFMGEMGLDPGIDHMSAMQKIDEIKAMGGKITAFSSNAGGLVALDCLKKNPWRYKFTWNPRNVVKAGQGTAQYLEGGKFKYIPYNRLFREYRTIEIPGYEEEFEVYANRESLLYREAYGLDDIPTLYRGTIRYKGFCDAWNALVQIGLTDGTYPILDSEKITYHELMEAYLSKEGRSGASVKERVANLLGETEFSTVMKKLEWLGLFSKKKIGLENATPALILEDLLLKKWKLEPNDRDVIIMQHEFEYELEAKQHKLFSTLVLEGKDANDTAMARLVGLPLAIFAKQVMLGKITSTGVNIPVKKEIYGPVLDELKTYGVVFHEREEELPLQSQGA
ncbi:MAG: saccharopine dehydrogenase NADP-binding domain-containing protein [Lewinellaceae bacterium]|nr:saccharopine dehydrogenase NADP-binding domain-containing protein [Saprospiraceae bacterium]MCB9340400.1 saccharopine dehydrogenase NADP-binding domain-containing protein [Lewinellaceae bacterium]